MSPINPCTYRTDRGGSHFAPRTPAKDVFLRCSTRLLFCNPDVDFDAGARAVPRAPKCLPAGALLFPESTATRRWLRASRSTLAHDWLAMHIGRIAQQIAWRRGAQQWLGSCGGARRASRHRSRPSTCSAETMSARDLHGVGALCIFLVATPAASSPLAAEPALGGCVARSCGSCRWMWPG